LILLFSVFSSTGSTGSAARQIPYASSGTGAAKKTFLIMISLSPEFFQNACLKY
jgi:hypothetical protein